MLLKAPHFYASSPASIKFDGMIVVQKGKKIYVVKARAADLDTLCTVPTIPFDRDNREIATWVLSGASDKWQRDLDNSRVIAIAEFFKKPFNFIINSAVISIPPNKDWVTEIDDRVKFVIPIDWLVDKCPKCGFVPSGKQAGQKFDACPNGDWDGRPGTIIDGQHRIRGVAAAGAPDKAENLIAVLLTETYFSIGDMAKIFTEITTYAVDLPDLHKIYLLYTFKLHGGRIGPLNEADFSTAPPTPPAKNTKGLRNRKAYEIVCKLCSLPNSRWYDRITILPEATGRQRRGDAIEAHDFLVLVEQWLANGVFMDGKQTDGMIAIDAAVGMLQNYLEAILLTWPVGSGTAAGVSNQYWSTSRATTGWLQQRGLIEVFLKLFPTVTQRILLRGANPDLPNYKSEIAYIENIDWSDPAWNGLSNPDKNKEMLLRILQHIYEQAPKLVGADRVQPWVNSWIKGSPDPIAFIQVPSGADPVRNAGKPKLKFQWESRSPFSGSAIPRPLNAYTTGEVYIMQTKGGNVEVLSTIETPQNYIELDSPPPKLDVSPHALPVIIQVAYANANQSSSKQVQHPA